MFFSKALFVLRLTFFPPCVFPPIKSLLKNFFRLHLTGTNGAIVTWGKLSRRVGFNQNILFPIAHHAPDGVIRRHEPGLLDSWILQATRGFQKVDI